MEKFKNENMTDRLLRVFLGLIILLAAFYWIGGLWQAVLFVLGGIMLFTAISGFCLIYKLFGINTAEKYPKNMSITFMAFISLAILVSAGAGGYYSDFFTRKYFIEDFNKMNSYYKQALFNTGQEKRQESIENYDNLVVEYQEFQAKYSAYKPNAIRGDGQFDQDVVKVAELIASAKDKVYSGNLKDVHVDLEQIRPIFQEMFKRNDFSMLAISLVDFHNAMEKIIDAADRKDANGVIDAYKESDEKLKAVEETANDDEIKNIRSKVEAVLNAAKEGKIDELPSKAAEMKSAFIKVYLKRG